MARPDTFQFKSLLDSARSVSIFLPQDPTLDAAAAALSLKISLETAGKSVVILCPSEITVGFNRLVGIDTVTSSFGSRNLVISFPGQTEIVDKVSYNLEKGELQLVISPKNNAPDLDYRRLKFVSGTKKTDISLLVDVHRLTDLGTFYAANKDFFTAGPLVSVTVNPPQENYTNTQLFDPSASSLSELTAAVLDSLSLPLNLDVATNLLSGLEAATDQFSSSSVSPVTFETAARLLRSGAVREKPLSAQNFPSGSIPQTSPVPTSQLGYGTDSQLPEESPKKDPNPDWYEPKIYQGSMLP